MKKFLRKNWIDLVSIPIGVFVFVIPFGMIFLTATKSSKEAYSLDLASARSFFSGRTSKQFSPPMMES